MNPVFLMLLHLGASVVLRSAVKFSKNKVDDHVLNIIDLLLDTLKQFKKGEHIDMEKLKQAFMWEVEALQKELQIERSKK